MFYNMWYKKYVFHSDLLLIFIARRFNSLIFSEVEEQLRGTLCGAGPQASRGRVRGAFHMSAAETRSKNCMVSCLYGQQRMFLVEEFENLRKLRETIDATEDDFVIDDYCFLCGTTIIEYHLEEYTRAWAMFEQEVVLMPRIVVWALEIKRDAVVMRHE